MSEMQPATDQNQCSIWRQVGAARPCCAPEAHTSVHTVVCTTHEKRYITTAALCTHTSHSLSQRQKQR